MYYSGFADEAGKTLELQIKATKELGWKYIEARNINGVNLTDITDDEFEVVYEKLQEAGVSISCFGSAIANHGKDPRSETDFQYSVDALKRAIPRMQRLGTKMIRCMAFKDIFGEAQEDTVSTKRIHQRVEYLTKMCEEAGVMYLCENCGDYSGMSYEHALRLVDSIKSPAFKLIFDMGNTVGVLNKIGTQPYKYQDAWEFYSNVREFIYSVHIKDAYMDPAGKKVHVFPGEGTGDVKRIVNDLLNTGYNGCFSIEPHMHNGLDGYVEYGRRLMDIVDGIKK